MKIHYYSLLFLFLVTLNVFSQESWGIRDPELPTVIPPSPTVASLMRFEEVPVNHYSGSPEIDIPIFQKNLTANLDFNLTLRYNTSGIRIDERSGWTGTGWTLEGGGVISRTVMGLPDEESSLNIKGTFHNGFNILRTLDFSNLTPYHSELLTEFMWKTQHGSERYDYHPDLFQFNFAGYSGRFILVQTNNTLVPKILSSSDNLKITVNHNSSFVIDSFEIIDPYGNIFLFSIKEQTSSKPVTQGNFQGGGSFYENQYGATHFTSAWQLKSISNSNKEVLCKFDYQDITESYFTPSVREENTMLHPPISTIFFTSNETSTNGNYNRFIVPPKSITQWNNVVIHTKKLKKVIFRDSTSVKFNTIAIHPEYGGLGPGCKLNNIEIKHPSGAVFKAVQFDYFTTTPGNRLFLSKLIEEAGDINLPHVFSYHNPSELPGFGDTKKDRWGYYNGNNNELISPNLYANHVHIDKIKTGVLKEIKYPTGGKKEFNFEPNSFSYLGDQLIDVHTIPQNRQLTSIVKEFTTDVGVPANQNDTYFGGERIFYLDNNQAVNLWYQTTSGISTAIQYENHSIYLHKLEFLPGQELQYNPCFSGPQVFPNINSFDVSNALGINTFSINNHNNITNHSMTLSAGWYLLRAGTPQPYWIPPGQGSTILTVETTVVFSEFCYNTREMLGGGLRIKDIVFSDYGQPQEKTSFSYLSKTMESSVVNPDSLALSLSSGSFDGSLMMTSTIFKEMEFVMWASGIPVVTGKFNSKKTLNSVMAQMTKGNYVGYKNITVKKQGNGRTDYTFTSPIDYPTYPSSFYQQNNLPYDEIPLPDQDYKRGLLLKREIYNQLGDTLKIIEKIYDFNIINQEKSFLTFFNGNCPINQFYPNYQLQKTKSPSTPDGWNWNVDVLAQGTTKTPESYIGMQAYYLINGKSFLIEERTKEFFYEGTVKRKLNRLEKFSYNMANHQVSDEYLYLIDNSQNEYYRTRYYYPVGMSLPVPYDTNVINKMVELNKVNEVLLADIYKDGVRLNRVINRFEIITANQVLPKIIEVAKDSDAEEARILIDEYDEYDNPTQMSLANGPKITYLYGYNGQFPVAKIENADYIQVLETGVNTTVLNNPLSSQGAKLNELNKVRDGLPQAMVTTYTHEPLKGMTTITDPKGTMFTYHYDPLGRLKYIKDSHDNYVEEYEYNYREQ